MPAHSTTAVLFHVCVCPLFHCTFSPPVQPPHPGCFSLDALTSRGLATATSVTYTLKQYYVPPMLPTRHPLKCLPNGHILTLTFHYTAKSPNAYNVPSPSPEVFLNFCDFDIIPSWPSFLSGPNPAFALQLLQAPPLPIQRYKPGVGGSNAFSRDLLFFRF